MEDTKKQKLGVFSGWDQSYRENVGDDKLWGDEPIPVLAPAIAKLTDHQVKFVVDLGCGDGRNLIELCRADFACCGVDISPSALERAAGNLNQSGQSAFLLPGSLTNLPFASNSVEAITAFDVFGQEPDSQTAVQEFQRVLMPGGLVLLNAFSTDDGTFGEGEKVGENIFEFKETIFRYFEHAELIELFGAGWTNLSVEQYEWTDAPHGSFRPYIHRHVSLFLTARRK